MSILIKEHFNRWYSLGSYYISITLVDLPISVSYSLIIFLFVNVYTLLAVNFCAANPVLKTMSM